MRKDTRRAVCPQCKREQWVKLDQCTHCGATVPPERPVMGDLFADPPPPAPVEASSAEIVIVRRGSKKAAVFAELVAASQGKSYEVTYEGNRYRCLDGWVPSTVLAELAGWRFVARLFDLVEDGALQYESRHVAGSIWEYKMTVVQGRLEDQAAA